MRIIITIISISVFFCQQYEAFHYKTKFRKIRAGKTKIVLLDKQNDPLKKIITIESFSSRLIDLIYKLRHFSTIIVDNDNYSLLATTKKIQQGKYIDSYNATIDNNESIIYYQNTKDIINNINPDKIISIPFEGLIYDPFGIVFYLRELDLGLNQEYTFKMYSKTTLRDFSVKIIDIQTIKTPYNQKECYVIVPKSLDGKSVLKNNGEMKIWITIDSLRIPMKIQQKMKHGTMELILEDYVKG